MGAPRLTHAQTACARVLFTCIVVAGNNDNKNISEGKKWKVNFQLTGDNPFTAMSVAIGLSLQLHRQYSCPSLFLHYLFHIVTL